ncbi:MAG: ArsR/SmtB family transcription factor [Halobacteriales archaeon]
MADAFGPIEGRDLPFEEVFAVLGNTTRLQILNALFEEVSPATDHSELSFSTLYDRVDYDTPANFSYHINQLVDLGVVAQTDTGYTLTLPGTMMVRKLIEGWTIASDAPLIEPTDIDVDCPRCQTTVRMSYYGGILRAYCPCCADGIDAKRDRNEVSGDHPVTAPFLGMSVPPTGLVGRDPNEVFHGACAYFFSRIQTHLNGICPTCAYEVDRSVVIRDDYDPTTDSSELEQLDPLTLAEVICPNCKTHLTVPVRRAIQTHAAVTAFYYDHGIDHEFVSWDAYRRSWTYDEEILSTEPIRIRITVPLEDSRLDLTVDDTLCVVEHCREGAGSI